MNNCIIYNKGEFLGLTHEKRINNVGRESETYLHYIIENYHTLPYVVVFTQARISDHKGANDVNYLIRIKNEAIRHSKSQNFFTHHDVGKCVHFDKRWNVRPGGFFLKDNYKHAPIVFKKWFQTYICIKYPNPIHIYGNAIFAVKRELILNKPLEYYKWLISEVNHHINPAEGHFFERSWHYLFR
jgi:hypothetical protein